MTRNEYWSANASAFPFHAVQMENITASFSEPEQLTARRFGTFIRVPFLDATPPHVLWGFQSETDRDAFLADFGGDVWLGGVSS